MANFQLPTTMVYSMNDFRFCVELPGSTLQNLGQKSSYVPIFHISLILRGFLLTIYDFRKSGKLWQLGGNGFWNASRLNFKTLQSFACLTLPEKRDKEVISKIWIKNLPQIITYFLLPVEVFTTDTNYVPPDIAMTHQWMEFCCCSNYDFFKLWNFGKRIFLAQIMLRIPS